MMENTTVLKPPETENVPDQPCSAKAMLTDPGENEFVWVRCTLHASHAGAHSCNLDSGHSLGAYLAWFAPEEAR